MLSRQKWIWYVCLIGFFAIFSTSVSKNPVLPLYAGALGADSTIIGLISAVSPLAGVILSFPIGVVSDKIGRRGLILVSGIICAAAPLLYLIVPDPLWLIPVRFLHGTATATLAPVISAAIADRFGEQKGLMMGTYSSATLFGRTAAPLVGGAVLTLCAALPGLASYRAVYLTAFAAGLAACILTFFYREEKHGSVGSLSLRDFTTGITLFLRNRTLRSASAAQTATYFCFGTFETFLPVYLLANGVEAWLTGLIFGVQVLILAVTKPWFGRLADQTRPQRLLPAGLVITGASLIIVPLTGNPLLLFAASILFGTGMSLSSVAANVCAANAAEKNQTGASLGALSSLMDVGHSSGPLAAGLLITAGGYGVGFAFCTVLAGLTALYTALGSRKSTNTSTGK